MSVSSFAASDAVFEADVILAADLMSVDSFPAETLKSVSNKKSEQMGFRGTTW